MTYAQRRQQPLEVVLVVPRADRRAQPPGARQVADRDAAGLEAVAHGDRRLVAASTAQATSVVSPRGTTGEPAVGQRRASDAANPMRAPAPRPPGLVEDVERATAAAAIVARSCDGRS